MSPEQVNEMIQDLMKMAEAMERAANARRSDFAKALDIGTAMGWRSAAEMLQQRLPGCRKPDPWEVSA